MIRALLVSLAAVMATACATGTAVNAPAGFPYAVVGRSCGPADGPATAIYLTPAAVASLNPKPPYVLIYIWQPAEGVTSRTWNMGGGSPDGTATFYPPLDDRIEATGGTVIVSDVDVGRSIRGAVNLVFPGRDPIRGDFSATWIEQRALCG